jgi:hypothetical protein
MVSPGLHATHICLASEAAVQSKAASRLSQVRGRRLQGEVHFVAFI